MQHPEIGVFNSILRHIQNAQAQGFSDAWVNPISLKNAIGHIADLGGVIDPCIETLKKHKLIRVSEKSGKPRIRVNRTEFLTSREWEEIINSSSE